MQRQRWTDVFGQAPPGRIAQLKAAGRYRTTSDANLRDVSHQVVANVPKGSIVEVREGAETSTFSLGLFSIAAQHTWASWNRHEGWFRDKAMGASVAPDLPKVVDLSTERIRRPEPIPVEAPRTIGKSQPMGVGSGRRGVEPASTLSVEDLQSYARADHPDLEDPGVAKEARPLGLGRPAQGINPDDYRIVVRAGRLFESTGTHPLTVVRSPFVLSSSGQLYGGQGEHARNLSASVLQNHAQPMVAAPAWAGELAADNGRITYLNNRSGTFMLHDRANLNMARWLFRNGLFDAPGIRELEIDRVYQPGLDREGKLERHQVLGDE